MPRPNVELWSELLEQVVDLVVCQERSCWLDATDHGWYVEIMHVDVDSGPHVCPACPPRATPRHILSTDRLLTRRRPIVLAELARWLAHLHPALDGEGPASQQLTEPSEEPRAA